MPSDVAMSSDVVPSDVRVVGAPLCIDISCPDGALVITPVGEADVYTVAPLRHALTDAAREGSPRVVVDLDRLTFMDASTLGVLLDARHSIVAAGGTFTIRCHGGHPRRLLSLIGLEGTLDTAP
jgi:anti-anti-sigma factor